jgi:DNA-binding HxlR family transcriptional regulator
MALRANGSRAGSLALSLLADQLNIGILNSLSGGRCQLSGLRELLGGPPKTTLRNRLRHLEEAVAVNRRQDSGFPGQASYELTSSGERLLGTADVLAKWLDGCPEGAVQIGSPSARNTIKALEGGWSTNILRALATRPLSLTELDRVLTGVNYPTLERRLDAMRLSGQVASTSANGTRPYSVTRWLREAVAPLAAAVRWECGSSAGTPGLHRLDVETLFLLAVPMLRVVGVSEGSCRLEVLLGDDQSAKAGVTVRMARGGPASCRASLEGDASSWIKGTPAEWMHVLSVGGEGQLESGGDRRIATALNSAFRTLLDGGLLNGGEPVRDQTGRSEPSYPAIR